MARSTRGSAMLGPGPRRMRDGSVDMTARCSARVSASMRSHRHANGTRRAVARRTLNCILDCPHDPDAKAPMLRRVNDVDRRERNDR